MPIKIFFCYAHEDETLLNTLKKHLRPLQRQGLIDMWHDRDISAGTEWEHEIKEQLNNADMILLLISPDFMDSDYCYGTEMQRALERHAQHTTRVIPVILRPTYWQGVLGKLQAIPKNAIPVVNQTWHTLDDAFHDVEENIRIVVEELAKKQRPSPPQTIPLPQRTEEQWFNEGYALHNEKRYQEAIAAYTQAISLNPKLSHAYSNRGWAYTKLKEYQKAITDYTKAISLNSTYPEAYHNRGLAYYMLQEYQKAIADYTQAISLDSTYINAYYGRGRTYYELQKYQKAIADYDQALTLDPHHTDAKKWREEAIRRLPELPLYPFSGNQQHLNILKQGGKAWNLWRDKNRATVPSLTGANLRGADLTDADLRDADLRGATLTRAALTRAALTRADLRGAILTDADLRDADLTGAHLGRANLTGAKNITIKKLISQAKSLQNATMPDGSTHP